MAENKRLTRINNEMEKVISGEQEKLNEQRDYVRTLKAKLGELQSIINSKDHELN
jgi:hypothetical protein